MKHNWWQYLSLRKKKPAENKQDYLKKTDSLIQPRLSEFQWQMAKNIADLLKSYSFEDGVVGGSVSY